MEKPNYDYMRHGYEMVSFVLPPNNIDEDNFEDEIPTIAAEKIGELQERLKFIEETYKTQESSLLSEKIDIALNIPYLVARFGYEKEKYYIARWVKYWGELAGFNKRVESNDQLDIESARKYPIEDLYSGNLRKVTNRLQGLCPFHEEKTPSFFIFPDNHFHCFGCQEHGSAIDFLMKTRDMDFVSAVKELQR